MNILDHNNELVFGFFLTEGFSLPAYTSIAETFRIANDIAGLRLFRWYTIGRTTDLLRSASNLSVKPDMDINTTTSFHQVAIISSLNSHQYRDKTTFQWLRRLNGQGCALGGITSGCWILAKANLLKGYRFTLHWQDSQAFKETYPELPVSDTLYEIDRNRFSCASGLAALDMVLQMIVNRYGYELAQKINDRLINERFRSGSEHQVLYRHIPNPTVKKAVELMDKNIEIPLPLESVATQCSVSSRQLLRLFKTHVGISPQQHYLTLRLDKAVLLLQQTNLTMTEIAIATGFANLSYFSVAFSKRALISPSGYRKKYQTPKG
jgi:transcriptional regulator GlxA family with amidase domain